MKILITGATGFIGAALAKKLSADGHIVHALVRSKAKLDNIAHPNIIAFQGDLSDKESIRKAMVGCEQVYHLAAYAKVWAKETSVFYDLNVVATMHLLEVAEELGVSRMVYTSTASVYGASIRGVINEKKARDIDFFNEYEGSKALAESKVKDSVILNGMDIVIVCPTRVYGPYLIGETNSVTKVIERYVKRNWRFIPGDGTKLGNYIYIDDAVDAHIAAMQKGKKGETYILGGPNHSYIDFFKILREVSGIRTRLFKYPVWAMMIASWILVLVARSFNKEPFVSPKWVVKAKYDWEVSPLKMETDLGVKGRSLKEGLRLTVDWLKKA